MANGDLRVWFQHKPIDVERLNSAQSLDENFEANKAEIIFRNKFNERFVKVESRQEALMVIDRERRRSDFDSDILVGGFEFALKTYSNGAWVEWSEHGKNISEFSLHPLPVMEAESRVK